MVEQIDKNRTLGVCLVYMRFCVSSVCEKLNVKVFAVIIV